MPDHAPFGTDKETCPFVMSQSLAVSASADPYAAGPAPLRPNIELTSAIED